MIPENQRLVRTRDNDTDFTCIVCPIGCRISVTRDSDDRLQIAGNKCARGARYVHDEFEDPRRVVTGTCAIRSRSCSRLPVHSEQGVPVDSIPVFLNDMYSLTLTPPVHRGEVVARSLSRSGIGLIASMTVLE